MFPAALAAFRAPNPFLLGLSEVSICRLSRDSVSHNRIAFHICPEKFYSQVRAPPTIYNSRPNVISNYSIVLFFRHASQKFHEDLYRRVVS